MYSQFFGLDGFKIEKSRRPEFFCPLWSILGRLRALQTQKSKNNVLPCYNTERQKGSTKRKSSEFFFAFSGSIYKARKHGGVPFRFFSHDARYKDFHGLGVLCVKLCRRAINLRYAVLLHVMPFPLITQLNRAKSEM